jgi:hypothetical protein
MTAIQILTAMATDPTNALTDEVLRYLNEGMLDEWDCTLSHGLQEGFGNSEFRVAAKAGLGLAIYHKEHE